MPGVTIHLAMWSGPRNISTAMMRSWENRPDCRVVDEPFYACYLSETGLEHPCREEILQAQSTDRKRVIQQLADVDPATHYFYQKHMTHHMPRGMDMRWSAGMRHCFMIRDPAEVIASYLEKMPSVSEDAIGIVRQWELFEEVEALTGRRPVVIDSNDVLRDPGTVVRQLCEQWGLPFLEECMLQWPAGRRESDGAWAHHWYQNVEASTGFASHHHREVHLPPQHQALAEKMQGYYQRLAEYRLRAREDS
jgi:hypothetical protein